MDPDAWKHQALYFYEVGRYRKCIMHLEKCIELDNTCADVYVLAGKAYEHMRRLDMTISICKRGLKNVIEGAESLLILLGRTLDSSGLHQEFITPNVQIERIGWWYYAIQPSEKTDALDLALKFIAAQQLLGLCHLDQGDWNSGLELFQQIVQVDPKVTANWMTVASVYRILGNGKAAEDALNRAVELRSQDAYYMRGCLFYERGFMDKAIDDFQQVKGRTSERFFRLGVCFQALGRHQEAYDMYTQLLMLEPTHCAFFLKESLCFYEKYANERLRQVPIDKAFEGAFKTAWSRQKMSGQSSVDTTFIKTVYKDTGNVEMPFDFINRIGKLAQVQSPGFMTSHRQHRMFGLAVLEMYNALKDAIDFRTFFNISVNWRRLAEPTQPVWWIDTLTTDEFEEGLALETPLIAQNVKVARYYPYYDRVFAILKHLAVEQLTLTDSLRQEIQSATDCESLYAPLQQDFWVETESGIRITIKESETRHPIGYSLNLIVPHTPMRWIDYNLKLERCWENLLTAVDEQVDPNRCFDVAAELYYYWINFSPLTRGSAVCGWSGMIATMLFLGYESSEPMQMNKLYDLEALLAESLSDFKTLLKVRALYMICRCVSKVLAMDCTVSKTKVETFK